MMAAFFIIKKLSKPPSSREISQHRPAAVYQNLSVELLADNSDGDYINDRYLQTILAVACLFTICWLPHFILIQIQKISNEFQIYAFILGLSRNALNPILCVCVNKEFRVVLNKLKCC